MQLPPASVLKSWPTPNFIDPETRGPAETITVSILIALATLILCIRVYTRLWVSNGFGLDDVLILIAYIPTTAFAIIFFVAQSDFDWGRHIWDLPLEFFTPSLQLSLSSQLMFDLSTNLTKLSMLSLIYRVVSVNNSRYRYVVIFLAAVVALDGTLFFFIAMFQCSPPEAYWTLSATPQACIDEVEHLLAAGCINTTTDFLIVLVPIPYVRRLQLPRKQQIVVVTLFAGGLFVTAAGAARTAITFATFSDPKKDLTWNAIPVGIASALELYVGIICASIPSVKPFFARYLPTVIGNPMSWLSRGHSQNRSTTAGTGTPRKTLGPDFWILANRHTASFDADLESRPSTMQMSGLASLPGMPTAHVRPSWAQSSPLRPISTGELHRKPSFTRQSGVSTLSSITTTSTAILDRGTTPDLNKPLPILRSSSALNKWAPSREGYYSIYQFVAHEDGHMSVHKASRGTQV